MVASAENLGAGTEVPLAVTAGFSAGAGGIGGGGGGGIGGGGVATATVFFPANAAANEPSIALEPFDLATLA